MNLFECGEPLYRTLIFRWALRNAMSIRTKNERSNQHEISGPLSATWIPSPKQTAQVIESLIRIAIDDEASELIMSFMTGEVFVGFADKQARHKLVVPYPDLMIPAIRDLAACSGVTPNKPGGISINYNGSRRLWLDISYAVDPVGFIRIITQCNK